MEMALAILPVTLGVNLCQGHGGTTTYLADRNSGTSTTTTATAKPSFQEPLQLRSPNKPCTSVNRDVVQLLKKPKPCDNMASNTQVLMENKKNPSLKKCGPTVAPECSVSDLLHLMDALSLPLTVDMYATLIKECIVNADSHGANGLHNHISRSGVRRPLSLLNRLLLMHVHLNRVDVAHELFDRMVCKDFKSWAVMIVAYVNRADYEEALRLFLSMLQSVSMEEFPAWMMVCLLKTCVCTENVDFGKQLHACSLKLGLADDLFLTSCLINFYGKFGCLASANMVFDILPRHSIPTWIARLMNNLREELFLEVFRDFREIGNAGMKKNALIFSCVLRACARMNDNGESGRQVHANAIKLGFERDREVVCELVDMYGRCGLVGDAKRAFEMSGERRNNTCWDSMLAGYIRSELYIEAIKFVYQMKAAGVRVRQSQLNRLRIACGSDSLGKFA